MRTLLVLLGIMAVGAGFRPPLSGQAAARPWPVSPLRTPVVVQDSIPILQQLVSLDLHNVPLGQALKEIDRRAKLGLAYTPRVVPVERRVSLRAARITAGAALDSVLAGTGVRVEVTRDGAVTLVKGSGTSSARRGAGAVVGRVTDSTTGRGLPNAEVFLQATRWATATDTAGLYRLLDVDPGTYMLVVRRLGYAKQTRRVTVRDGYEDTVNVAVAPAAAKLDELVTTATGRQRRRDIGNLVTTINADSVLRRAPVRNLSELLENRVPGLTVQHTSGAPGDPSRLRLRGLNSVRGSNDPVFVVDGVRVYAAQSEARSGNLTNGFTNQLGSPIRTVPAPSPLDQIDPNTIEKVEVLSGASAATLYGADAANGVVVITTKRGKPGPTHWSVRIADSRETTPGRYPVGYYRWGRDLLNEIPRFCTLQDLTCVPDSLATFQALNEPSLTMLGRGGRASLSATASGGNQALTYSVTGSYADELGLLKLPGYEADRFRATFGKETPDWMRRPHHYTQWGVTSAVNARLGSTAEMTLSASISRSEQQRTNLERQVSTMSSTYVDTLHGIYYSPASNLVLNSTPTILHDYYLHVTAQTITFTTGLNANWYPRPWFTGFAQVGLNVVPRNDGSVLPTFTRDTTGVVSRGTGRSLVSSFNLQGALRKPLGHGFNFETNLGANATSTSTEDMALYASGVAPGITTSGGAKSITAVDASIAQSSYGWYIEPRVTGQRLSISAGLRLDGGSANGARITGNGSQPFHARDLINPAQLFGLRSLARNLLALPRLNGAWVISEEPWFPFTSVFSSLRLRGAFGHAQVLPGPTDRLRLYNDKVELTTLGNTQIRPERSTELEGGLDADIFGNRVSLQLTGYRKLQIDALMDMALPGSVKGSTTIIKNIGNIMNRGLALTLGVTPVQRNGVTWTTNLSWSYHDDKLTKLGRGVEPNPAEGLVEGYPVRSRWAKPIVGFLDLNGNGVVELNEIQIGDSSVFVGRLYPTNQTVLNTDIALFGRTVRISADFTYNTGQSQIDETAVSNWVLARPLFDPTASQGQQAAVVAYVATGQNEPGTTYGVIQQLSTFRFASLSVSYAVPARVARLLGAESMDFALQGSNLGLHSTYRGIDPNVNAWAPGEGIRDSGQLPQPRIWQLQVDLRY